MNERRSALVHDRLVCCLFERLLHLDSLCHLVKAPRFSHLQRLWESLLVVPVFGHSLVPWRYRLAVCAQLVWPDASMQIVQRLRGAESLPPLELIFSDHAVSPMLQLFHLKWSQNLLLLPTIKNENLKLPPVAIAPSFGKMYIKSLKTRIVSRLQRPDDAWTDLLFCLVTRTPVQAEKLQDAISHILADFAQRKHLSGLIFEVVSMSPNPVDCSTHVHQLIRALLSPESLPYDQARPVGDNREMSLDPPSPPLNQLTLCGEGHSDVKETTSVFQLSIPHQLFSSAQLLPLTVSCVKEAIGRLFWQISTDVRWLLDLMRGLGACRVARLNESVIELLCCLLDALRDAIKMQLMLKRWRVFLSLVDALNRFGDVVTSYVCCDRECVTDIWCQIARQISRLAQTAWIAGGVKWPRLEEDSFAPEELASAFCGSFGTWVKVGQGFFTHFQSLQLHSLHLLDGEDPLGIPLGVFLAQKNPRSALQAFRLLQKLVFCFRLTRSFFSLAQDIDQVSVESALVLANSLSHQVRDSYNIDSRVLLCTMDSLLHLLVLTANKRDFKPCGMKCASEKENAPLSTPARRLPHSLLSTVVSVCCHLIRSNGGSPLVVRKVCLLIVCPNKLSSGSSYPTGLWRFIVF